MMLINLRLINNQQLIYTKIFVNRLHLILQISKISSQNFVFLHFCVYRVRTKQGLCSQGIGFSGFYFRVLSPTAILCRPKNKEHDFSAGPVSHANLAVQKIVLQNLYGIFLYVKEIKISPQDLIGYCVVKGTREMKQCTKSSRDRFIFSILNHRWF